MTLAHSLFPKNPQKYEHPDSHLAFIFLITGVPVNASLVTANSWFSREFDRTETHTTMLVRLHLAGSGRGHLVGHSLDIFLDFLCINHCSSPRVRSVYHRKVARPELVRAMKDHARRARRAGGHTLWPTQPQRGRSRLKHLVPMVHQFQ